MAQSQLRSADRVVRATAPVRVCDLGGWTDTRFSDHGEVVSFAVRPGAEVQVAVWRDGASRRVVHAIDYGESLTIEEGWDKGPDRHKLLAAAVEQARLGPGMSVEVTVSCRVPPGSSTGTSAAVAVAVLGALDAVAGSGPATPAALAKRAHRLEVERLGQESGVQDQLASSYGGANHIVVGPYPESRVRPLALPEGLWWELEQRLVLVCLGRLHGSSALHEKVIASLGAEGPSSPRLELLRKAACMGREAIEDGDLAGFGRAMAANTDAQASLHPDLVCALAWDVIAAARSSGALGWKVNGAGGDGGSLTVLAGPDATSKAALLAALAGMPEVTAAPVQLSHDGLRVWEATVG
jgi:D-glycero-alpha-D-manno-heptose-7-phosphate kinase